jgi:glycosyltransferase involved in cell wall biosynthesis
MSSPARRMRVVHVGKFYPPVSGGMERVLESLCEQPGPGIESRAIVCHTKRTTVREERRGVGVTRVGTVLTAGSVPIAPSFSAELRRADGDLLVIHEPNPWALLSLAIARPALPVAVWFHSEVVRPRLQYQLFYQPLARRVYERARRIIVSSPMLAEHARALKPYQDRVRIVPFGIDLSRWDATPAISERCAAIRTETGSRPLILFAGRMVPYKGVGVLLKALSGLDASAVLVGDGPCRAGWMAQARELNLAERVRFAGEVPHEELAALYHACDMFVLPSVTRAEAFGYVQLEAMACGKPVVSTRLLSGVPWVNRHGESGLTVPPGDVEALRRTLAELAGDAALRARLGEGGRRRVASEFTMEIMRAAAADLYREAAES